MMKLSGLRDAVCCCHFYKYKLYVWSKTANTVRYTDMGIVITKTNTKQWILKEKKSVTL